MTPKEFVKSWFANIDANNFGELDRLMDKNHQFHNPMTPAAANKAQHLDMIKGMSATFTDNTHHLDIIVSEGDWVTARGRVSCRHTGEFNGVPGQTSALSSHGSMLCILWMGKSGKNILR